jgi:hypothetical protein
MSDTIDRKSRLEGNSTTLACAARGAGGAMIATSAALAVLVLAGMVFPSAVFGPSGVGLCGALGAVVGSVAGRREPKLAWVLGGGIGGVVAGWFAISAAELFPPGTWQWADSGGALAILFSLPVAAVVGGLVGLASARVGFRGP